MAQKSGGASEPKNSKKIWLIRVVATVLIIGLLALSLIWEDAINRKFGLMRTEETEYAGLGTQEVLELGGDLNVHFVDVGQGDACIVELPDDKKLLIDAGDTKKTNKNKLLTYIDENIKDAEGNTIKWFDYAVLTHPDSDHCGGMYDVLTEYPAKTLYRPNVYSTYTKNGFTDPATVILENTNNSKNNQKDTAAYGKAIEAGYNIGKKNGVESTVYITDATNEEISLIEPDLPKDDPNYYSLTFYAPIEITFTDWNDYSPVMILDYHDKKFMLSGDAEKAEEASFVAKAQTKEGKYSVFTDSFTVDVFKLGHHGSRTSSSEAFIEVMTTAENRPNVIAVVSCGEDNSYGHPHKETLDRLKSMNFAEDNIVRTDVNGTIAMSVRGEKDESTGAVTYELYMGAETVRHTVAAVGNDSVQLTWREIAIAAMIIVAIVLIVLPIINEMNKNSKRGKSRRR